MALSDNFPQITLFFGTPCTFLHSNFLFLSDTFDRVTNDYQEVFYSVHLRYRSKTSIEKKYHQNPGMLFLKRPNYPNNCYTLDLSAVSGDLTDLSEVAFTFIKPENKSVGVDIIMEDKMTSTSRNYLYNQFSNTGPRIHIDFDKLYVSAERSVFCYLRKFLEYLSGKTQ